jgi:MOSC domain-containing protein YiiM
MGYSADHYPFWRRKVPEYPFEYGAFGENFTLSGMTEDSVCIADVYQIGGAVIQVTTPRQPCWKLSRKVGNNQIGKLMIGTGYSGWYFSVVMEGFVEAGLPVRLVERSQPEWPIRRFNDDIVYA